MFCENEVLLDVIGFTYIYEKFLMMQKSSNWMGCQNNANDSVVLEDTSNQSRGRKTKQFNFIKYVLHICLVNPTVDLSNL